MSYHVFWSTHAELRLEEILQDPQAQAQIAAAARDVDQYLRIDPMGFGESRYGTVRVGFAWPIGIQYEVFEDIITVIVYDVWRIDIRKSG